MKAIEWILNDSCSKSIKCVEIFQAQKMTLRKTRVADNSCVIKRWTVLSKNPGNDSRFYIFVLKTIQFKVCSEYKEIKGATFRFFYSIYSIDSWDPPKNAVLRG